MSTAQELSEGPTIPDPSLNSSAEGVLPPAVRELKEWAVVFVGREPGVFFGTSGIMDNVHAIPGSFVVKYVHETEARNAFDEARATGKVERVTLEHVRTPIVPSPDLPLFLSGDVDTVSTWRVVYVGRQPGIFTDVTQTPANTLNIPGSRIENFKTYEAAVAAYLGAVVAGQVVQVKWSVTRETLS